MDSDIDRDDERDDSHISSVNDRGTSLNGLTEYVMGNKSTLDKSIKSVNKSNLD